MAHEWSEAEITYLRNLAANCQQLAQRFNEIQAGTRAYQHKIRIPVICLSSIAGVASFGSNAFEGSQLPISVAVGAINLLIGIANAVNALFGLTDVVQKSTKCAYEFARIRERVEVELALPPDKRASSADVFVREIHNEYVGAFESAPLVLKNLRFISGDAERARSEVETIARDSGMKNCC